MADHLHTIDRWDDATGGNLIEQIAGVGDYLVALATYRAAVNRWPKDKITLRNRARLGCDLGEPPTLGCLLAEKSADRLQLFANPAIAAARVGS